MNRQERFRGHDPLPDSHLADLPLAHRWFYCFQDDWAAVVRETLAEYQPQGYEILPGRALSEENPDYAYWQANAIMLCLEIKVRGITLLEDSVTLIKDCRLFSATERLGPEKERSPGWITAIVARPHRTP